MIDSSWRNDKSFLGLESVCRVKTGRFFFWKFRDFEMVELSWVTYPEKIKKKLRWSYCNGRPTRVKNAKIFRRFFQNGEKYRDFLKWSCCNERPAQVKNTKILQRGEKCRDFSKWSCCNGRPARVENEKSLQSGEKYRDFSKVVLL